ncbi:MAG TPA: HypC/HybG/HupF family hydrogenase formation chaperone [Dissulfurispiraceae bacterium]|nr:HypC/HybG/HupF family hydrogenase formation chaperone [Dissulfurispiraceae bacterium]
MCLAVPSKVINIDDLSATVDVFGARREISLLLLPEEAKVGDYVLVHAGFAIQKIDEAVALDSMRLIREYAEALEEYEDSMPEQPRSIFEA